MKIKFPFFSKKFPWVCTTEQVVHQVDGKDKKLSDILGESGGSELLCIDITGMLLTTPHEESNGLRTYQVPITNEPNDTGYILQTEIDKIDSVTGFKPAVLVYYEGSYAIPLYIGMVVGIENEHGFIGISIGVGDMGHTSCSIQRDIDEPDHRTLLIQSFALPT